MRPLMWLVGLGLISGVAWAGTPAVENPFIYYSFDDAQDLGKDSSGNNYDGVVHGNVTGVNGYATFDGGLAETFVWRGTTYNNVRGSDYIDMQGADVAGVPSEAMSFAAWVRLRGITNENPFSHQNAIFNLLSSAPGLVNTNGPNSEPAVWAIHPEIHSTRYRMTLRNDLGNTVADLANPTNAVPVADEWVHVAATFQSAGQLRLYIDGELTDYAPASGPLVTNWDFGAYLGMNIDGIRVFEGDMDEFYIFGRELTAGEVQTLASIMPIPEPANLVLLGLGGLGILARRRR